MQKEIGLEMKKRCPNCGELMVWEYRGYYCPVCVLVKNLKKAKKKGLF